MGPGWAHVYWFAPSRTGNVFRVRQRLCNDCYAVNVLALTTPPDVEELTCSACGIDVEDDVYPIYITCYVKGQEPFRGAMALCEEHQLELKVRADRDSLALPDRYLDTADAPVFQSPPAEAVYRALGRVDPRPNRAG